MADNTEYNRGFGIWLLHIYQPDLAIGPYTGTLVVNKDFHTINTKGKDNTIYCVASIPSQNVAYVVNQLIKEKADVVQNS